MSTQKKNLPVQLGDEVRDKVSGLGGIVTAQTQYLNGCVRVQVQPPSKKGATAPADAWCVDVEQLVVVKPSAVTPASTVKALTPLSGGSGRPETKRQEAPRR